MVTKNQYHLGHQFHRLYNLIFARVRKQSLRVQWKLQYYYRRDKM